MDSELETIGGDYSNLPMGTIQANLTTYFEKKSGKTWPSRGAKFSKGDTVLVECKPTSPSLLKRYKTVEGKEGVITAWKLSPSGAQSEYMVFFPELGRERWCYADVLHPV